MKMTLFDYFRLLLFSLAGSLLLCTVFAADPELADGLVMGKVWWFQGAMAVFAGCVLFGLATGKKSSFSFSVVDGLLLLLACVVLATYDWALDPEPIRLLFGGQLLMLWFLLRVTLGMYPTLRMYFISIVVGTGLIEAAWGMGQLHGVYMSNHTLFRLTGSFFNPGPFSGYLAVVLPISLGIVLCLRDCRKSAWWQMRTVLFYLAGSCLVVILIVLPAGMSRSAWIAAFASCAWVCLMYGGGGKAAGLLWRRYRGRCVAACVLCLLVGVVGLVGIYRMKKDSADGRLLMWKLTAGAIADRPLAGTGMGGFPASFAEAQADYFASGAASDTEKRVAGCPEYAFNEYLQIGVELGVGGLLLFVAWLGCVLFYSAKNKRFGTGGGVVSLMVFSFSSYPLQLPSFWVLLLFISAIAVADTRWQQKRCASTFGRGSGYIGVAAALGALVLYGVQRETKETYIKWNNQKSLYNNKAYEVASRGYEALYPRLKHRPEFLFESAQCLSKAGREREANVLLQRAVRLSADPMLHYMMAKNEQTLGQYADAEKHLLYAIDILPERLYPYFLLTKLYADPAFYRPDKMKAAADSVLTKEPKVQTTAVKEMRREVEKMLNNIQ